MPLWGVTARLVEKCGLPRTVFVQRKNKADCCDDHIHNDQGKMIKCTCDRRKNHGKNLYQSEYSE